MPPNGLLSSTTPAAPISLSNLNDRMNLSGIVLAGHAVAQGASVQSKHRSASILAPKEVREPSECLDASVLEAVEEGEDGEFELPRHWPEEQLLDPQEEKAADREGK